MSDIKISVDTSEIDAAKTKLIGLRGLLIECDALAARLEASQPISIVVNLGDGISRGPEYLSDDVAKAIREALVLK